MAAFSVDNLLELRSAVSYREHALNMKVIEDNTPKVLKHIKQIINMDSIFERLKQVCTTYQNPWDLKLGIYGYNGHKKMAPNSRVTLDHVIDRPEFLYLLDEMFNGDRPLGGYRFRVTVRNMEGFYYGWREIMLHYYDKGVPRNLIRSGPKIADDLPASPVEVNPEDDDMHPLDDEVSIHENDCRCEDCCYSKGIAFQRDDESVHGGGCTCRKCRSGYNNM